MINTIWLRSFCTLVDLGHFTRTAERLHMTQPGVSQHVRKLEEQLGFELLIRQGKQFTLTDAGERLYNDGRQILSLLSGLEQSVRDDPADAGLVRVMSPGSAGLRLYPRLLALQQRHPGLVIDHRFGPNSDIERAIANDQIDVGLMTTASTRKEVHCQSIAREALLLVTPSAVTDPSWQQLTQLGFIDHPDGAHHANLLLAPNYPEFEHSDLFNKQGFSNQIGQILEPVSLGLGFTVLPAYAVEAFTRPERIRSHKLPQPVSEHLYLATRRHHPIPNRVQSAITEIRQWL